MPQSIELYNRSGMCVARVWIKPQPLQPEIVLWNSRLFALSTRDTRDDNGIRAYIEALMAPAWESEDPHA